MNAERREQLAQAIEGLIGVAHKAVVASWPDLMPVANTWRPASVKRAKASARAALEGIVPLVIQGDLDDRSWDQTREVVWGQGKASREEVAELLRSVRVVGVELFGEHLEETVGLTHAEHWSLQQLISSYCDDLLGDHEEVEGSAYTETLAELEQSGPDIR